MKPVVVIIIAVVSIIGGFVGGMEYQKRQTPQMAFGRQFAMQGSAAGQATGPNGNRIRINGTGVRPVIGEIMKIDDTSITVKTEDGSKIVLLSETTSYVKTDSGSKTDLKIGENVSVFGTENSDGSTTAQNIQLNPQFRTEGMGSGSGMMRPSN